MPDISNQIGNILKKNRKSQKLTRDQLSEKVHISYRYLTAIENENKKPSYDVLFRLIRELGISANEIFYPESQSNETQKDLLILLLDQCDTYEMDVVTATVKALLKKE